MRGRWLTVGLLVFLIAIPTGALTRSGQASTSKSKVFAFTSGSSGQILLTLFWKKRTAKLAIMLVCDNVPVGVSAGNESHFQRLEVGLPAGSVCEIGVTGLRGSSKFWINIQYTGGVSGAIAQGRWAAVATPSPRFPAMRGLIKAFRSKARPQPP